MSDGMRDSGVYDVKRDRSCICTYCGYSVDYADTSIGEVARVRDIMRDHDIRCQRNPLVEEIAALREQVRVLTPLARLGLAVLDGGKDLHRAVVKSPAREAAMALVGVDYIEVEGETCVRFSLDTPDTAAARRIVEGT